jgi:putative cardiolipin synthase
MTRSHCYKNILLVACLVVGAMSLGGCATALPVHDVPPTFTLPVNTQSHIGRYVGNQQPEGAELSGFRLLDNGGDALAARLQMIELAEQSVDLQYYIYNGDTTGALIADKLIAAADRGVRVRMLLDDIGNELPDLRVATLDQHPNINIRLFNPVTIRHRWFKYLSKAGEFGRINHRMHNKLMIADGQVFVTGGRNIGDQYFALSDLDFQDVDILGIGSVTNDVSRSFDEFWNSRKSIPVPVLTGDAKTAQLDRLRTVLRAITHEYSRSAFLDLVAESPYNQLFRGTAPNWYWGMADWIYDPPEKADPNHDLNQVPHVVRNIVRHLNEANEEVLIMTAYFIPGNQGEQILIDAAERVDLKVLTNSLATTDVLAVHSKYATYRKRLLVGGVQLWELRPIAAQQERASPIYSDSSASLHAKSFVFDQERVFVGSINLDPRSITLNTESGVLVYQKDLAQEMTELFNRWSSDDFAYELRMEEGRIRWHAEGQIWSTEPEAARLRRASSWLLRWLPIERQL